MATLPSPEADTAFMRHLPGFAAFLRPRGPLLSTHSSHKPPTAASVDRFDTFAPDIHSLRPPAVAVATAYTRPAPSSSRLASPHKLHLKRATRYLREADRRAILQRIRNGEKQADLAKEYQVSRAAISNLKQRRCLKDLGRLQGFALDVESQSSSPSATPLHEWTSRRLVGPSPRLTEVLRTRAEAPLVKRATTDGVYDVATPTMDRLLSQLQHESPVSATDQHGNSVVVQRLVRLLLEEALIQLPYSGASSPFGCHGVSLTRKTWAFALDPSSHRVIRDRRI